MNILDMPKLMILRDRMTPRPWPITTIMENGSVKGYEMNCGQDKIRCRDMATLEFVQLAVGLADILEVKKSPKVDSTMVPAQK